MRKFIYCFIIGISGLISQAQNKLTQGEYFWDTDPGQGFATALVAADGNFDSVLENVLQNTAAVPATPGLHILAVRFKDNQGSWGPVFKNVVHTGTPATADYAKIAQGEYFWDADPGEGSGSVLVAADGNFDNVIENVLQNTASVPATPGLHVFTIRFKDNLGVWGPAFKNVIHLGTPATADYPYITQAEYFWDADPGEGSGTALTATDGNFDGVIESVLQSGITIAQPAGFHTFNVRIKDNKGAWSPAFKNIIYIETTLGNEDFSLNQLVVYPNPVKDILNIDFGTPITAVVIHNLLGQEVLAKSLDTTQARIDVSNLTTGTYLVKVLTDTKIKTVKIIKE